jgi:hypothetical protein
MWARISARLVEVIMGLLLAGVLMALLVPAMGASSGPLLAAGVAGLSVTAVLLVARGVRRGKSPADRR